MGFTDYRVDMKPDEKLGAVFIYDHPILIKENLPVFVESVNHLLQMISRRSGEAAVFFDVNNYRQERENLITELARAAAKRVLATKEKISLPAMNSYERRLVHVELAIHPEVMTESVGDGRERCVVIKLVEEAKS